MLLALLHAVPSRSTLDESALCFVWTHHLSPPPASVLASHTPLHREVIYASLSLSLPDMIRRWLRGVEVETVINEVVMIRSEESDMHREYAETAVELTDG